MNGASLNDYIALAQILAPIIALAGIVVSMWLSVKALREGQLDRKLRMMPHLAFDYGGRLLRIEFVKTGRGVSGIGPTQHKDTESISLKTEPGHGGTRKVISMYGKLRNYGLGVASSAEVTWIAKKVRIGSEKFDIDSKTLLEPQYSKKRNCIPSSPSHIVPGEAGEFFRLPTFIHNDFDKKISEVEGILLIECEDLYGGKHITNQEFFLFMDYRPESPTIHITFSDLLRSSE